MSKQYCDIVVVDHYSVVADESVDEVFRMSFGRCIRSKRTFATHYNKLTIFYVESKKIDLNAVKQFENFLKSNGFTKLYSAVYSHILDIDARFFTINLNIKHFSDLKDLLISKIETTLGKKLKVHEDIYYFNLTKSQIKSRRFIRLLDELLDNPAVKRIICI